MEVRSHEYVKVAWSHDGRRSARHRRCACRHLQCRRRVQQLREQRDLDVDVQQLNDHTHDAPYTANGREDRDDAPYTADRREDRDDAAFGSASGEALVPGYGLRFRVGIELGCR
jgi:hypothetical protein